MFMHATLPTGVIKQQGGKGGLVAFIVSTEKPKTLKTGELTREAEAAIAGKQFT